MTELFRRGKDRFRGFTQEDVDELVKNGMLVPVEPDPNLIVMMTATEGSYGPKVVATSPSLFIDLDEDIVFDEMIEGTYLLVRIGETP